MDGISMKSRVLFLCTGNSARSQMAEGYLRHVAGEEFEALSAGVAPKMLHPLAVEVMREAGIDIRGQRSKEVREFSGVPVDFVVTVCNNAREQCPIFPAVKRRVHWDLEDPAASGGTEAEKLAMFRTVRDQIFAHIMGLVREQSSARD
jgi:arsenate reductase